MSEQTPQTPITTNQFPPGYGYTGHFGPAKNEIDLKKLIVLFWRGKWIIGGITFVFAVIAVIYALSLPNMYRADAKLAPTEESRGGGMAGQLGGLASLAGVNLPRAETDNATLALEIIRSRQFITNFVQRRGILIDLMAAEDWSESRNELIFDADIYDQERGIWLNEEGEEGDAPSDWDVVKKFREHFAVATDELTGFSTIAFEFYSPYKAQEWVAWIIQDINNELRRRDVDEATRSRDYLENELVSTSLESMRQGFFQMIEKQTQTIMMANVRPEYVFRVIDPPVVPDEKSRPARAIITILITFVGFSIGMLVVFLMHVLREEDYSTDGTGAAR